MKSRYFLIVCLLVCVASPAWATTYYMATNGSNANSCATATSATPTNAKASLGNSNGALACLTAVGDVLKIHAGTYSDFIAGSQFPIGGVSWTPGRFQTIQDAGDGQVIIRPTFISPFGTVLSMPAGTVEYILFKNLTIDALHQSTTDFGSSGALYAGANNLTFDTVEVLNGPFFGIEAYGDHNQFINMHVHRNGNDPIDRGHAAEGIYMSGSYNTVTGGEYDNNECNAFRVFSSDRTHKAHDNLFSGLLIHDNGLGHAQLTNGLSQCRTGGGAMAVGDYNNTVVNNVVYNAYWGFDDTWGQDRFETGGNLIANNTFYNVDYCCNLYEANTRWFNNICFQVNVLPPCSMVPNTSIPDAGTGLNDTVANNLLNTDPLFVDVTTHNFQLQFRSPAKDAGITVPSVVNDFLGAQRPYGPAYDIGAYELGATAGGPRAPLDPSIH